MRETYLNHLQQGKMSPLECPTTVNEGQGNEIRLRLVANIVGMLQREGINPVVIGSPSVSLNTNQRYPFAMHDTDFLIKANDIEGARKVLEKNDFIFWDENSVHREVRNLTGGFGRHHNLGASSQEYLNSIGLPIWTGFFTYPEEIVFQEDYAFSKFKLDCAVDQAMQMIGDVRPESRQRLTELREAKKFGMEEFFEVLGILDKEGARFWDIIDMPEVNQKDVARREKLIPNTPEQFIEVSRDERYAVSIEDYIRPDIIDLYGVKVPVVDLSTTFWRMKKYFPHYLGPRDKYIRSAVFMEGSGFLPEDTDRREGMYRDRKILVKPTNVFTFERDACFNSDKMGKNCELGEPNYWAMLLEGIHYVKS
jgi:hypothetical protein